MFLAPAPSVSILTRMLSPFLVKMGTLMVTPRSSLATFPGLNRQSCVSDKQRVS